MANLPKSLRLNVALACYAIVSENFASFQNPVMRGQNFQWESFPKMMQSRCETSVFLNVAIPEKHINAVKEFAANAVLEIATRLVQCMSQ